MEFMTYTNLGNRSVNIAGNTTEVPDFQVIRKADHLSSDFFLQPG